MSEPNADRIVACVNACAGIPAADQSASVYPAAVVERLVEALRNVHLLASDDAACDPDDAIEHIRRASFAAISEAEQSAITPTAKDHKQCPSPTTETATQY